MEDREGENDEVPRRMWKAVAAKTGEVRIAKAEGRRKERRRRKETRRERGEEEERKGKEKETKNNIDKKYSGRMGDLG